MEIKPEKGLFDSIIEQSKDYVEQEFSFDEIIYLVNEIRLIHSKEVALFDKNGLFLCWRNYGS